MPRATWGVLQWIATHATAALLVALAIVAWFGWHQPAKVVQVPGAIQQVPVGQTRTVIMQLPGTVIKVPEVVTAPSAGVRVITTQPAVVTPEQQRSAVAAAPEHIQVTIRRICVHPEGQAPDPTCGKPLSPDIDIVRNGGGASIVQTHDESVNTQLGLVTTTLHVPTSRPNPYTFRVGVAATTNGFGPAAQVQYTRGPLFAQGTLVYTGTSVTRGFDGLLMVGIQF